MPYKRTRVSVSMVFDTNVIRSLVLQPVAPYAGEDKGEREGQGVSPINRNYIRALVMYNYLQK